MVWHRIKRLWGGGQPPDDDTVESVEAEGAEAQATAQPPDPVRDGLVAVDAAVRDEDMQGALARVRALLLRAAGDRRVLERAALVLARIGEPVLAEGFGRAAASRGPEALTALAEALLALDDPDIALALGQAALARAPEAHGPLGVVAAAHEARNDPGAVIDALERLAPAWPSPALARRYAAAIVACGAWERWDEVAPALENDPEGGAILAAAERARAFTPEEGDSDLRQRVFVRYGAVLLDEDDRVTEVGPERLATWIAGAAALLLERLTPSHRIAYVGPRSEVIAGWLADALGTTAMPLSARLPHQPLVVAVADDDDLEAVYGIRQLFDGPSFVVQALKDPRRLGGPMADVVGAFAEAAALPFEALEAERAADRLPPKLLVSELRAAAGELDEAPLAALFTWSKARRGHLSLDHPSEPERRAPFTGL